VASIVKTIAVGIVIAIPSVIAAAHGTAF